MRVIPTISLSAIALLSFSTTANAQDAPSSYGGIQITAAPTESQPILPRRPERSVQHSNIQITNEEQRGFGAQDEYRLNYQLNISSDFTARIQSPLIQETSNTRHGVEISGYPRLEFSWLLGKTDGNQPMSNQREGVNYNPFLDPNIDQSTLSVFDRQTAKWQSEPVGQLYGMNRF